MPLRTKATEIKKILTTHGDILTRDAVEPVRLGHGVDGQFLKTQGAGAKPIWDTVEVGGVTYVLGDLVAVLANDTLRTTHSSAEYVKLKEVTLDPFLKTVIRTSFEMKTSAAGVTVYGVVYKDGVPHGSINSTNSTIFVEFVEDLDFSGATTYEVWGRLSSYHTLSMKNQRVWGSIGGIITAGK